MKRRTGAPGIRPILIATALALHLGGCTGPTRPGPEVDDPAELGLMERGVYSAVVVFPDGRVASLETVLEVHSPVLRMPRDLGLSSGVALEIRLVGVEPGPGAEVHRPPVRVHEVAATVRRKDGTPTQASGTLRYGDRLIDFPVDLLGDPDDEEPVARILRFEFSSFVHAVGWRDGDRTR